MKVHFLSSFVVVLENRVVSMLWFLSCEHVLVGLHARTVRLGQQGGDAEQRLLLCQAGVLGVEKR
jgi:hypothetical protein